MAKSKVTKSVSDEQIIAALLEHGTQRAAAAAVGVDEKTIYNRMNDGEFQALYKSAKADIIRSAVFSINSQLEAAVKTIIDVMQDEKNNAAVRLQAAQTILNNAGKFAERLQTEETRAINQKEVNEGFLYWG